MADANKIVTRTTLVVGIVGALVLVAALVLAFGFDRSPLHWSLFSN